MKNLEAIAKRIFRQMVCSVFVVAILPFTAGSIHSKRASNLRLDTMQGAVRLGYPSAGPADTETEKR